MAENHIQFDRFTQLKAKVKAEMQRRNKKGSVASYGGASYDYSDTSGIHIKKEHYEKNIVPLRAVNSNGLPGASGTGKLVSESDLAAMEGRVAALEAVPVYSSSTGCASSCTGLCSGGCSGTCHGSCTGGCSGCGGACSYGCGVGCSGGCSGCGRTCSGRCEDDCVDACDGTCKNNCGYGCGSRCSYTCLSGVGPGGCGPAGDCGTATAQSIEGLSRYSLIKLEELK